MQAITVLIADDEALIRSGLRMLLQRSHFLSVVGEASNGLEAVRQVEELRPAVVLMDLQMPVMDGIEATRNISEAYPATRVIAITTFASDEYVVSALRAGASAYLVKDTEPDDLISAVRDVVDGACVISPAVTSSLVASVRMGGDKTPPAVSPAAAPLTPRELEIVELLGRGLSNAEIAGELHLSEATVKTHLGRVMTKWGVRDRVQTLIHAVRAELIDLG